MPSRLSPKSRESAQLRVAGAAASAALAAAAFLTPALTSLPAAAQSTAAGCSDRTVMVKHLKSAYGETRLGAGLQSETGLMELYVSKGGSWTLLLTRPDGTSCPVAVGENWLQDNPADPTDPDGKPA